MSIVHNLGGSFFAKKFLSAITYLIDLLNYLSDLLNKIFIFQNIGRIGCIIHENVRNREGILFFTKYLSKSLNYLSYPLILLKKGIKSPQIAIWGDFMPFLSNISG